MFDVWIFPEIFPPAWIDFGNIKMSDEMSDLDQQIEQLRKCEIIKESDVKNLCAKAREILGKQPQTFNESWDELEIKIHAKINPNT